MKTIKIILVLVLFISCSEESIDKLTVELTEENNYENDISSSPLEDNVPGPDDELDPKFTDPNFTGTICLIKRNSDLELKKVITYEYITRDDYAHVSWEITSGNVEIISDVNSSLLEVRFNDDFENVRIKASGFFSGENNTFCSEGVEIIKK